MLEMQLRSLHKAQGQWRRILRFRLTGAYGAAVFGSRPPACGQNLMLASLAPDDTSGVDLRPLAAAPPRVHALPLALGVVRQPRRPGQVSACLLLCLGRICHRHWLLLPGSRTSQLLPPLQGVHMQRYKHIRTSLSGKPQETQLFESGSNENLHTCSSCWRRLSRSAHHGICGLQ